MLYFELLLRIAILKQSYNETILFLHKPIFIILWNISYIWNHTYMIVAAANVLCTRLKQERAFPFAIAPFDWYFMPNSVLYIPSKARNSNQDFSIKLDCVVHCWMLFHALKYEMLQEKIEMYWLDLRRCYYINSKFISIKMTISKVQM